MGLNLSLRPGLHRRRPQMTMIMVSVLLSCDYQDISFRSHSNFILFFLNFNSVASGSGAP